MRKALSALAALTLAAGVSVATASPAAAEDYCFGLPSQPLAFVCVGVNDVQVPDPQVTWGTPIQVAVVPAACYGIDCTEETPVYVSIPGVSGVNRPTITVYWNGYTLPGDLKQLINDLTNVIDPNLCFKTIPVCL